MECIQYIERFYENMNVNCSIVVCETPHELDTYVRLLEGRCFTCVFLNTQHQQSYANHVIMTLPKQFQSQEFWDILAESETSIDCVFFSNMKVSEQCVTPSLKNLLEGKRYFLITL